MNEIIGNYIPGILSSKPLVQVIVDGKLIGPEKSLKIANHSPDGFNWGYSGSGPAQMALAILLEVTNDEETALDLYQDFKAEVIAILPRGQSFKMNFNVGQWIANKVRNREATNG